MTVSPVDGEPTRYWVSSSTRPGVLHLVDLDYEGKPACSCHDHQVRGRICKHLVFVLADILSRNVCAAIKAQTSP